MEDSEKFRGHLLTFSPTDTVGIAGSRFHCPLAVAERRLGFGLGHFLSVPGFPTLVDALGAGTEVSAQKALELLDQLYKRV